jgi:hypothetical protein
VSQIVQERVSSLLYREDSNFHNGKNPRMPRTITYIIEIEGRLCHIRYILT